MLGGPRFQPHRQLVAERQSEAGVRAVLGGPRFQTHRQLVAGGGARRVRGQGGGHTLDRNLDILPLRFAPSFPSNFEFLAQTCNPRSKLGREERKA